MCCLFPLESALATALEIISSSIQSAWESGHTASTVPLLAWVSYELEQVLHTLLVFK